MLKDIIAIIDNVSEAKDFIGQAVTFAEAHDAHLTVTVLTHDLVNLLALAPEGAYAIPFEQFERDERERLDAVEALVAKAAIPVEVRGIQDVAALLRGASRIEGRYADLLLIGPPAAFEDSKLRRRTIETALMSSGAPVLILPAGKTLGKIGHAAVGWDASGEAHRALRDLMAIIEPGGRIDVVTVDAAVSAEGHGQSPGSDIARHLARHGYQVEVFPESSVGSTVPAALQDFAFRNDADLLTVGAFGHSRVRDILLGGVTRDLVENARVPVLLSR